MIYRKKFYSLPLTIFIITTFLFSSAIAHGAYLRWNANTEEDVAGYKIYYGTSSDNYNWIVSVANDTQQYDLSNLYLYEDVSYYIAITAYDSAGNESGLSSELHVSLNDEIPDFEDNCTGIYNPEQEDTYPPGGNDIGNACECEGDLDCDGDVDGVDSALFRADLGRNAFFNSCAESDDPCNGDFDCDGDVDGADSVRFKADMGRNLLYKPCPECMTDDWCAG